MNRPTSSSIYHTEPN